MLGAGGDRPPRPRQALYLQPLVPARERLAHRRYLHPTTAIICRWDEEGTSLRSCLYTQTILEKAGPFSVARLKMDLPFHNRLAYNRVHRTSASLLDGRPRVVITQPFDRQATAAVE